MRPREEGEVRQVRRDRRPGGSPRRQSQARRSDGPRRASCSRTAPGKTLRVLVFAKGEKEREARGGRRRFRRQRRPRAKVQEGFMDFDRVIATPDMMGAVGKLGRILGPRGLMPNPKVGTVTFDVRTPSGGEGRQGRVPRREGGHRPRPHRQGLVRREALSPTTRRAHPGARSRRSRRPPRASTCGASPHVDDGPRRQDRPARVGGAKTEEAELMERAQTKTPQIGDDQGPLRQDDLGGLPRLTRE